MNDAHASRERSKTIFEGRVFTVSSDRVIYPDGRAVTLDVIRHPGSVVLIPMAAVDRIVLIRQYRYAVDQWLWELPAGTMDHVGESAEDAARRECQEEIGRVAGTVERLATFYPSPGFCDEAMHFFLATDLRNPRADDPAASLDHDELIEAREFALSEARLMVERGEILDMKTAVGLSLIR